MNLRSLSSLFVMGGALAIGGCVVKINDTDGDSASGSTGAGTTAETTTGVGTSDGSDSMPATSTTGVGTSDGSDSATAATTTGEPSTTTSASGSSSSGTTGGGAACDCADNEYCAFKLQGCGQDPNDVGICAPRPDACDAVYQPACGCDGMVYGNACSAALEGIDVSAAGGCAPPDGFFPCGAGFCDLQTSYCEVQLSDVVGEPDVFTCKDLPKCDPLECACLAEVPCGDMCEVVDGGGLKVNCPGG